MAPPEAPTTAPAGADHPQEKRTCAYCKAEKVVTPETWVYRKSKGPNGIYQAHGARCMACERKRKGEYEQRRDKIAAILKAPSPADTSADKGGKRKERLDITAALKAGANVLNEYAPSALARLIEYMEDPDSPHHQWALEHFLQRIQPRKLMEELGGQAAGVGALQDKRPQFIINVQTAQPGGVTYENGEEPQPLLPAPAEESEAAE